MIPKASAHWSVFEKARIVLDDLKPYANGNVLDVGLRNKVV